MMAASFCWCISTPFFMCCLTTLLLPVLDAVIISLLFADILLCNFNFDNVLFVLYFNFNFNFYFYFYFYSKIEIIV